jgi:hypothetical protein
MNGVYLHASHNNDFFSESQTKDFISTTFRKVSTYYLPGPCEDPAPTKEGTISKKWAFESNGMTKVVL